MLRLDALSCGHGAFRAVHELSLEVSTGTVCALLGPNGAGKSSTIMAIAGHGDIHSGAIYYRDRDLSTVPTMERVQLGIAVVPEGRHLFTDLTVDENLLIGGYIHSRKKNIKNRERVLELFPRLAERTNQLAGLLSGGEQQMLNIGRALMADPKLLLVDELSMGLMPTIVDMCYHVIRDMKATGMTVLLVEQNAARAIDLADSVCVLESGYAVWQGTGEAAHQDEYLIQSYMGLREGRAT